MSQIQHVVNENSETAQKAMSLLGMSELAYAETIEQTGKEYMKYVLYMDDWSIDYMSKSRLFWGWFRNLWYQRESSEFLPQAANTNESDLQLLHKSIHSPLKIHNQPHADVIEDSYDKMIVELNKTLAYV